MKLYSALQIDEIGTKIAAKIKAILAKTDLLKTAAYKDVGTTAGKIPEIVGGNGIGGFGYGGSAKKLAAGADLDLLPRVNALYTGGKNDGILNRPPDLVKYAFGHEFVLECVVGDGTSLSLGTYVQRLSLDAYPPGTTSTTNPVMFVRTRSYMGFSAWTRLTGKMYGVDIGGGVIGDDIEVNSIKAGATSPKIAFELIKKQINYSNVGYNADGTRPNGTGGGTIAINSTVPEAKILSIESRVYIARYSSVHSYVKPNYQFSDTYYNRINQNNGFVYAIKNAAHAEVDGGAAQNGQLFFDKDSYIELFVIYKVD